MKTFVKDVYRHNEKYLEKEIVLEGWIRNIRALKNFGFIELNDGTFFKGIQIVYSDELSNFSEIEKLHLSSSVRVKGVLKHTPKGKQAFEIQATDIEIEGYSSSDYPLQKKKHTMEYLRTIAHLRPRSNTFSAVFRVRSIASYAIHKFFQERDFVYVNPPIITSSDAEGAGEMFKVSTLDYKNPPLDDEGNVNYKEDFFGKGTFLTVSGQLEAEAYALSFKNIYTFGPTFRAENSNTSRHAAEFWMMEPEIAFADLEDNMNLAEEMMKYVISYVMNEAKEEMEFFDKFIDTDLLNRLDNIVNSEFERITYTEAVKILKESKKKFNYPVEWGIDLQTEHERYITEEAFKKPVFVTDYPKDIKAFYMRENDDKKTVAAMDLLVPGVGEIIGGSQREERLELLEQKIIDNGMNPEDYWWYLELRKYGGTKHAGFGLGFERLIMYMTGMTNIRDVIPFPRTVNSAEF